MDDIAFDRLTQLFSFSQPRRGTLRAALGLVLGGAVIGRSPDALAADDELAGEAVAGGRGALGDLGGGSGGKRQGSRRKRGKGGGGDGKRKRKRQNRCARAGELRKDGKPCCKGLYRDSADRCIRRQPEDGSAGGCDPKACPSDPATKERGFCCPGGFCSCNNTCCDGSDCWIHTVQIPSGEGFLAVSREYCSPEEAGCVLCPSSGESCCSACVNGECASSGPIRGGSIRRR